MNVGTVTYQIPSSLKPNLSGDARGQRLRQCREGQALQPQSEFSLTEDALETFGGTDELSPLSELRILTFSKDSYRPDNANLTRELEDGWWVSEQQGRRFYIGQQQGLARDAKFVATCHGYVTDIKSVMCSSSLKLQNGNYARYVLNPSSKSLSEYSAINKSIDLLSQNIARAS